MDTIARLDARQRAELFGEAAALRGTTPAVVEKDFWVSWALARLFADAQLARWLMFKGGTSLSKAFGLIERFSEDIDLILDWRVVCGEDPMAARSKSKQIELNAQIDSEALGFIAGPLLERVQAAVGSVCACELDGEDGHVINLRYPAAFADTYLRPEIRLEIGPLAAWMPNEERRISSYAAQAFPHLFAQPDCGVRVIRAERTFWEKVTILHPEAFRPESSPQPLRYSRHYYDLARMAASPVRAAALADLDLLAEVVAFKTRFYPRAWARYDLAVPGSLRLVPEGHVRAAVEKDYRAMTNMIFGVVPPLADIFDTLGELQEEINKA